MLTNFVNRPYCEHPITLFAMSENFDLDVLIRQNLNRLLEIRGIQQNTLAKEIGVPPSVINDILKGRRPMGKNTMTLICKKLEVEPWEFYVDEKTPIVTSGLEQRALYMVREAEKEHLNHIAEEAVEYTINRIKQSKKKLQTGKTGKSRAARPAARRR